MYLCGAYSLCRAFPFYFGKLSGIFSFIFFFYENVNSIQFRRSVLLASNLFVLFPLLTPCRRKESKSLSGAQNCQVARGCWLKVSVPSAPFSIVPYSKGTSCQAFLWCFRTVVRTYSSIAPPPPHTFFFPQSSYIKTVHTQLAMGPWFPIRTRNRPVLSPLRVDAPSFFFLFFYFIHESLVFFFSVLKHK